MSTSQKAASLSPASPRLRSPDRSLYVHVPFCAHTCDFCAFYQVQPKADSIRRYLSGVERELGLVPLDQRPHTVFWGGGTPGLLLPRDLEELGGRMRDACGGTPAEWTVEIAPGSARPEKLKVLRDLGVSRISMGVQSFNPRLLDALGRQHSLEQVRRAIAWVRDFGFPDFNIDLIFGIPGQSLEEWREDLEQALAVAPDHISTYCLTFEEDTALDRRLLQGNYRVDREAEARYYELAHGVLSAGGYRHYEVSNFAREGHLCRHNLITWEMGWWAGVGPSAASQQETWRGANPPDLDLWLSLLERGERGGHERSVLTPELLAVDRLVFGLRTDSGVHWDSVRSAVSPEIAAALRQVLDSAEEGGLLNWREGHAVPTPAGFLVADAIGADLLEAADLPPNPVR